MTADLARACVMKDQCVGARTRQCLCEASQSPTQSPPMHVACTALRHLCECLLTLMSRRNERQTLHPTAAAPSQPSLPAATTEGSVASPLHSQRSLRGRHEHRHGQRLVAGESGRTARQSPSHSSNDTQATTALVQQVLARLLPSLRGPLLRLGWPCQWKCNCWSRMGTSPHHRHLFWSCCRTADAPPRFQLPTFKLPTFNSGKKRGVTTVPNQTEDSSWVVRYAN
jgi:hypothetical protein